MTGGVFQPVEKGVVLAMVVRNIRTGRNVGQPILIKPQNFVPDWNTVQYAREKERGVNASGILKIRVISSKSGFVSGSIRVSGLDIAELRPPEPEELVGFESRGGVWSE